MYKTRCLTPLADVEHGIGRQIKGSIMQRTSINHQQAGFTLVECMVALVVLAVGMLGVAALYIEGLRAERTSVFHTTAVNMADACSP